MAGAGAKQRRLFGGEAVTCSFLLHFFQGDKENEAGGGLFPILILWSREELS